MTGFFRRGLQVFASALPPALALLCLFPPLAGAQEGGSSLVREERVETGRFGVEEPESPGAAPQGEPEFSTQWLYLGLRAGPSLRFYTPTGDIPYTGGDTFAPSMDAAFQANFQFLSFLSLQGEVVFTWDSASRWAYNLVTTEGNEKEIDRYTWNYNSLSLQFPLTARLNFYPGRFRVSPFLGTYFLLPLGDLTVKSSQGGGEESGAYGYSLPLGLLGGLNGALKVGPGWIFADLRYAADLGELEPEGGERQYRRSMVSFTMGYELGFFTRKGRNHE
jgi:hypothetical protein